MLGSKFWSKTPSTTALVSLHICADSHEALLVDKAIGSKVSCTGSYIFHSLTNNSCAMGCPPVRGDNPRALASGLSNVHVDNHGITILYHLHQCRPCPSRDISC